MLFLDSLLPVTLSQDILSWSMSWETPARKPDKRQRPEAEGHQSQWHTARVSVLPPRGPRFLAGCRDSLDQGIGWRLA